MKSIGLIGGMSWESTALYYQIINREVARRLGGLHSARLHLQSLDFQQVVARQQSGAWAELSGMLASAGQALQHSGADCVLIGTNTMHRVAPEVQAQLQVPLLHIADATAAAIKAAGCRRVALLGTRYTMEQPFYTEHLARHGIACLVPEEAERAEVHRIIFDELCQGHCLESSRQTLKAIIAGLAAQGAEGAILGCTELPLLLQAADVALPLFDTTRLHALAAVDFALGDYPQAA
ncbi:aspartate/glutamate racemase family protein [Paucibacter soli]|uniref:aspartate/glutamate racemase family protein n=1 Tax=Paucibacter soli TaxID=3133433 RepID=UPI0030AEB265